jgi:hypothetical protein
MLYHFGTLDDDPSRRPLERCDGLGIFLLTPGLSRAFHANILGVSDTTIAKYVDWSRAHAEINPSIFERVRDNTDSISAEDGLKMAQRRGRAHLAWWSRLAIAEYAHRCGDTDKVARLFNCSRRTVQLALKRPPLAYDPLTGERKLSRSQLSPPGMWERRASNPGEVRL